MNGSPQVRQAIEAGGSLAKIFGSSVLYFARGIGLVQADAGGTTDKLTGCTS